MGFPIRTSPDHSFIASSPMLFAGLHVLRRLSSPRHPPDALIHLTLSFQELLWLCLTFRWREHQTWISYSDKAYCLLCLNPAFCLSGLSRYNHHPKYCTCFSFPFEETTNRLQSANRQKQTHCLCLLISAFQFVKDRCVQYCYLLRKSKWADYYSSLSFSVKLIHNQTSL